MLLDRVMSHWRHHCVCWVGPVMTDRLSLNVLAFLLASTYSAGTGQAPACRMPALRMPWLPQQPASRLAQRSTTVFVLPHQLQRRPLPRPPIAHRPLLPLFFS